MCNAQALRACLVREGARPAFSGHLALPWGILRGTRGPLTGGKGWGVPGSRGSYTVGRLTRDPPSHLRRRGQGTRPRPWQSQDGDQHPHMA